MITTCIAIQALTLTVLLFGEIEIGFATPGRFGLTVEYWFLCMFFGYLAALLTGTLVAMKRRRWLIASSQAIVPILILSFIFWPAPELNASDYQHLVGQTRQIVEDELGTRDTVSGREFDDRGEFSFVSYNGLTVYYDTNDIVDRIEPDL